MHSFHSYNPTPLVSFLDALATTPSKSTIIVDRKHENGVRVANLGV